MLKSKDEKIIELLDKATAKAKGTPRLKKLLEKIEKEKTMEWDTPERKLLRLIEDEFDDHWNSLHCKDSQCIFTSDTMLKIVKTFLASSQEKLQKEYEMREAVIRAAERSTCDQNLLLAQDSFRRKVEDAVHEMGDTSDYPSWGGAAGVDYGLIPKEAVLSKLKEIKI